MLDELEKYCDTRHRGSPVKEGEDRYRLEVYHIDNFNEPVHVVRDLSHKEAGEIARRIHPLIHNP